MIINTQQSINGIEKIAHEMRLRIVELTFQAGKRGGHLGGSLSSVEILATLFNSVMNNNPTSLEERDRLILSKGHAALALYCALECVGILSKEETNTFEHDGSNFMAHAKRDITKGIEFAGGSLGLGISYAVGVALACKTKAIQNQILVILGDGECDEGLVWEALMCAKNYNLTNLTVIIDHNHLQSDGFTEDVMDHLSLKDKLVAFGFNTIAADGHSVQDLLEAFGRRDANMPNAIIAETIKGKGVSFMENKKTWHHGVLTETLYTRAINDLNKFNS
jgi:transketolase